MRSFPTTTTMSKTLITLAVCGLFALCRALPQVHRNSSARIVGGVSSRQGQFPYQILLRRNRSFLCGGSLVVIKGQQVVVTAAHCVPRGTARDYTVTAGDLNRNDNTGLEQTRQVTRIVSHESYNRGGTNANDIAILFIDRPFTVNSNVAPIPLPRQGQQTSGQVVVSGWGRTSTGGSLPPILQYVQIPVVDQATCTRAYRGATVLPSMLCAGQGGRDSCQGDSGGPLRAVDGGYLAGIVSWGRGCALAGYPGVNTRVSSYVDWLNARV